MLNVINLTKIFKNGRGIKGINFHIPAGSFAVLIGPNGSGKTTLIRSVLRAYQEYDGEIKILGINNEDPKSFDGVSYIGEVAIFPRNVSLEEYLFWVGRLKGLPKTKIRSRVRELAETFDMAKLLKSKPFRFSSGEKQKVMLMKAIIENAKFIIMDEPTANLDPEAREIFFSEIKKLNDEGKSVLICSHNLDELENRVSHVLVISNGEQKYFGPKPSETSITRMFHDMK